VKSFCGAEQEEDTEALALATTDESGAAAVFSASGVNWPSQQASKSLSIRFSFSNVVRKTKVSCIVFAQAHGAFELLLSSFFPDNSHENLTYNHEIPKLVADLVRDVLLVRIFLFRNDELATIWMEIAQKSDQLENVVY
jgi:hypothetical protein